MTVDELIELTQALLDEAGFHLGALRDGTEALTGLTNEQFLLAVRFVAGERPIRAPHEPPLGPLPRRERNLVSLDEDELAERLARLEELDEDTPSGPIDIGDGVTLGL